MNRFRTLVVLALAGCGSAAPPVANQSTPKAVPSGFTALPGPHRCDDGCGVANIREVSAAGIRRIGVVARGLTFTLAIETARGWFFEPRFEPGHELSSHHQPHSQGYDLTTARVEDGALIVRLIDSQSVFYPGQGPAGTSHTSWFDRRCVVIDAFVHCGAPAQTATESCATELAGQSVERKCTGGPPPT